MHLHSAASAVADNPSHMTIQAIQALRSATPPTSAQLTRMAISATTTIIRQSTIARRSTEELTTSALTRCAANAKEDVQTKTTVSLTQMEEIAQVTKVNLNCAEIMTTATSLLLISAAGVRVEHQTLRSTRTTLVTAEEATAPHSLASIPTMEYATLSTRAA